MKEREEVNIMNVLLLVSPGALVLKQVVSSDLGPITK